MAVSRSIRHLTQRYAVIGAYWGLLFQIMALVFLMPLLTLPFKPHELLYAPAFLIPAALLAGIGGVLRYGLNLRHLDSLDFQESSLVVFIIWVAISLAGSIPYILISHMNFTHAVFDSVSGWTTTGLSLLDLTHAPVIILFYRAWAQLVGGAGIAIIMLAALTGTGSYNLYSAEGKGTLIKPNVLASARIVVKLYVLYMILGIGLYLLAGMNLLDSLVHCFAAISTGGFGNYPQNMGYFDSAIIESITILLMILGNTSFLMGYFLVKGKFRSIVRNGEIRVLFVSLLISIPLIYIFTTSLLFPDASKAFRVAVFEAVSALTTTGFSTVNYNTPLWAENGVTILIILMLIGGGTCSTAGGIKQYRIYMLYKSVLWQIKASLMPAASIKKEFIWEGDLRSWDQEGKLRSVANFVFIYLAFFAIGTMVIACSRDSLTGNYYSLRDSLFEFASALGTVGLSIGVTTTHAPLHVIWVETIGMLLGRLEFFVVFLGLIKLGKDGFHAARSVV